MAYGRPDLLERLIEVNTRAVSAYLDEQIAAGADAVMIFDTWGGLLSAAAYRRFSLQPMARILSRLRAGADGQPVPSIISRRAGRHGSTMLPRAGVRSRLDWTVDIGHARRAVGDRVALQGNLDPLVLLTDVATVQREAAAIVRAAGPAPGHVFNLGHGIVPATPPEHVAALVETVHRESRALRARDAP